MNSNIKKIIIFFLTLTILAGGLFLFGKKFHFLRGGSGNLAQKQEVIFSNSASPSPTAPPDILSIISPTPTPRPSPLSPKSILLDVPFFAQAPFGEWDNPVFQDGCEEAAIIMAWRWVQRQTITKEQAKEEIMAISDFEDKTYGHAPDRSAADTAHLMKEYTGYQNIRARSNISTKDINEELLNGNLVIVPVNGRILKNPFYTPPGPEHHMVVVIGYDANKNEFITNDIGTRHGEKYRYGESRLQAALQDYPTGNHLSSISGATAIIVVEPK